MNAPRIATRHTAPWHGALAGLALAVVALLPAVALTWPAAGADPATTSSDTSAAVPVEAFELDNGMKFLVVRKPELATVYGGWVAKVGSANERPGITGISHFFEHMMFKGSRTLGTTNIERDLEIIQEQEALQEKIRAQYRIQRERWRRGEIDDPFDPKNRTPELIELQAQFDKLVEEQAALMVKDEYDRIFVENGGVQKNAFTNEDMTVYFVALPANKLELWFWMESDRLAEPVFREFYAERDVVHEERRLRIESTPTGEFDEQFDSMFWQSHPYSWSPGGWPSDLRSYTLAQAQEYYDTFYAPNNLTAVLVGNFEIAEVKALAERYFARIPRGQRTVPDVVTLEMPQRAEKRMGAECDCQPQVEVRYHAVPFRHKDSYALSVMAAVLNGNTGRLYKSLVLDQGIATNAGSGLDARKYAGAFSFYADAKGDATPEQLEQAWYQELERLQTELVPAEELQKVKNQVAASSFRRVQNPFGLLLQLLLYEGWGDWTHLNDSAAKTMEVTAEDVQRVANEFFASHNRAVALYYRKAGSEAPPEIPGMDTVPDEMRPMVEAQVRQIRQISDPDMLQTALNQMQAQAGAAPPEVQPMLKVLEQVMRQRLEELSGGADAEAAAAEEGGES